jgi:hypothetical protein
MVPFTSSKPFGQTYNNNNAETILDNYVGNGSQTIKKIEQAPLFKPQENVQWPYGTPDMSDFYQSRQNPVNRNNMVKPFESVRVGPGLDKGYSSAGSHGFNAGMEARDKWLPKTVDELRITTNPKQEYTLDSLQGPAQAVIKNVGIEGRVEKYRPDTFFINTQDRWLTTTGAEKAGRMVAEEIQKTSNRNETTTYQHGTPNAILKTASYVPKKYEEPKRNQLEGFDVGPSKTKGTGPSNDLQLQLNSHTNYANNRAVNLQPEVFGSGFSRAIGAAMDCYDTALRYAKERIQFDKPIASFQLQQKKLAEMITEITKAQLLTWRLGVLRNEGKATTAQISMAKRNNVDMAIHIAREARQMLGGMGITGEYSIMRHSMNLESVITYEGTHDIHLLITGADITGIPAFK